MFNKETEEELKEVLSYEIYLQVIFEMSEINSPVGQTDQHLF